MVQTEQFDAIFLPNASLETEICVFLSVIITVNSLKSHSSTLLTDSSWPEVHVQLDIIDVLEGHRQAT